MPQFFLPPESLLDKMFHLNGPEAFHLVAVLRYREGQSLTLFDGQGRRWEGIIRKIHPDGSVSGELKNLAARQQDVRLNLYPALLKSAGWEYVLEKGTEIGVGAFFPTLSARCVAQTPAQRGEAKLERWRRIIMASAKQCQRQDLPEIRPSVPLGEAMKSCAGNGLTLLAWEEHGGLANQELRTALRSARETGAGKPLTVNLFIGPEGGFSEAEAALARDSGAVIFSLGPRILRAETACLAACALVFYELGVL